MFRPAAKPRVSRSRAAARPASSGAVSGSRRRARTVRASAAGPSRVSSARTRAQNIRVRCAGASAGSVRPSAWTAAPSTAAGSESQSAAVRRPGRATKPLTGRVPPESRQALAASASTWRVTAGPVPAVARGCAATTWLSDCGQRGPVRPRSGSAAHIPATATAPATRSGKSASSTTSGPMTAFNARTARRTSERVCGDGVEPGSTWAARRSNSASSGSGWLVSHHQGRPWASVASTLIGPSPKRLTPWEE